MKLRNLLFGTMIACAFAACSNEDDPIPSVDPTVTPETATASLTVSVKNSVRKVTKAGEGEGTQTADEAKINTLLVALYDATTGALVATSSDIAEEDSEADNDEVTFSGLQEGAKLRAIAFANMDVSLEGTTVDNFTSPIYTMPTEGFSEDNLPMSSGLSESFSLAEGKNYYGYNKDQAEGVNIIRKNKPLYLIRNVARIDLIGLSLDLTRANKDIYDSGTATIIPECVFIMHARKKSKAADMGATENWWDTASNTIWGKVYEDYTTESEDYVSGHRGDFVDIADRFTHLVGNVEEGYKMSLPATPLVQELVGGKADAVSAELTDGLKFYVLENPQTTAARDMNDDFVSGNLATELVIKGTYELENGKKADSEAVYNYTAKTAYWPIKIAQEDQMESSAWSDGTIHRNVIYSINATLAGKGYEDPTVPPTDFVELFVKTRVIDWGAATQSPVVE